MHALRRIPSPTSTLGQNLFPLQHGIRKPDQKDGLAGPHAATIASATLTSPVRGHALSSEGRAIAHALDDTGDEGGNVQARDLARHADELVDQHLVVGDHVLLLALGGPLQRVRRPPEQVPPQRPLDELQQREDARGPLRRWLRGRCGACEQQVEEFDAKWVALCVEPSRC